MPKTPGEFRQLKHDKLFSLDFSLDLLDDETKSRIPRGILSKIENDLQRIGIFSTRWYMQDLEQALAVYEGNLSISADGIWSDSKKGKKLCLIPIGTHSNGFDYDKGKGHTKEFRPFFYVIGTGESSAMVIAALIAARNFATKCMSINFTYENVSHIHCDGALAFTTLRDVLFPKAKRLACSVHTLRSLETALTKNFDKNYIHYITIKRQAYMLKYAMSVTQFDEFVRIFKNTWTKIFEEKQNEIKKCEDTAQVMLLQTSLMELQSVVEKNLFDNLFVNGPFCPSVGSWGQVPDTNFIEASMARLRNVFNAMGCSTFSFSALEEVIRRFCNEKLNHYDGKKTLYAATSAVDVVAIDEFKKLTSGIENVKSWFELKSFIDMRVRDCQFEKRRVLIMPAFTINDYEFVNAEDDNDDDNDLNKRRCKQAKVEEVTKENAELFLRSMRESTNEKETQDFLSEIMSQKAETCPENYTKIINETVGALVMVDVLSQEDFDSMCTQEKICHQMKKVLTTNNSIETVEGRVFLLCRCIQSRRRCQCGHSMLGLWRASLYNEMYEVDVHEHQESFEGETGSPERPWENNYFHLAKEKLCALKPGARVGRHHNPNKIADQRSKSKFASKSPLNNACKSPLHVVKSPKSSTKKTKTLKLKHLTPLLHSPPRVQSTPKADNKSAPGRAAEKKSLMIDRMDRLMQTCLDLVGFRKQAEKQAERTEPIEVNDDEEDDVTPEPTWEQFEKENPELSNVNFISEVRWDFSDELSEWEWKVYRAIERLLELLENNGTRVPSGRYAYKDVTHRKNKTVEVDFKDLERLRWSTDKVSNGLWLSTSIIDLLLLIFLHEKESNYQVWSANWWSTGLSETKTRANEDAKINEMICTETFKIFTGNEVVNKIILPVNKSNAHWILVVIDMKLKTISSYDSFGSAHPDVLNRIKKYLVCKAKAEGVKVTDEWTKSWKCVTASCPRQRNGYDCGMFVLCCARCVLLDWPISYFEQKDTAKEEVFVFEEKHMINLRRRFILEIHKLHLTNRMPDGIRDDEDEDEFDKYDPSTCPQEYIPIIQKLEKLEIKPDEYYLWYKRFSRALSFHVKADQLWFEENNEMRLCFPGIDHDSWKWSKALGREVFRKLFPAFEYYINKHFGYEYTRMLKLIEKYDDIDALQRDETGYGQWSIREAEMQDKNERSVRWLTRNFRA